MYMSVHDDDAERWKVLSFSLELWKVLGQELTSNP
jgi:hypothetical protein